MNRNTRITLVKLSLGAGGVFFIGLAGVMLFLGAGGDMLFTGFFLVVGLGFLLILDFYASRHAVRRPGFTYSGGEQEQADAVGGAGDEEEYEYELVGGGGGDGASSNMNHLETAEFVAGKIRAAASEGQVPQLIQQAVKELGDKGYSDKGMGEFKNRLLGLVAAISSDSANEQELINKKAAIQAINQLPF